MRERLFESSHAHHDIQVALPRQDSCKPLAQQAELQIEKVLEQYRKESERFDRVESASFDRRMQSLYQYRLERIESGRLPEP